MEHHTLARCGRCRNTARAIALDLRGRDWESPRRGTMKRTLLISVAAIALAAGSTVALSQGSGGGAAGGGNTPMANPSAAPGGQDTAPATKGTKGAQERMPAEKQQKSTQQAPQG